MADVSRSLARTGPDTLSQREIGRIGRLLPYLGYDRQGLLVDGAPVARLWDGRRRLLLYLPRRAVDNYHALRTAFARHFDVSVHCALKACYVQGVLHALRAAGAGIEIMSDLEWRLARRLGFTGRRIIADSVARPTGHLHRLLAAQEVLLGVDGAEELERTEWHARRLGVRPTVAIRVNPPPADDFFSDRSKLGSTPHEAYALLERAASSPHLDLAGLHAHQLCRCTHAEQFAALAERVGELAAAFATAHGTRLRVINLGGGLEARNMLERAGSSCEHFADAAYDALRTVPRGYRLVLEPGRFVFADAAIVLTDVISACHKHGQGWLITAISGNVLRPTSDRSYPPLPLRLPRPGQAWRQWHVADATCTPSRLWLDALLPADAAAHGLALLNTGAYTADRLAVWGTDLPDMGILQTGRAEITFSRPQQRAMLHAVHGIDLA